ncbi:MAG: FliH/SctL family protein [Oceanococcaceae bacterium]
MSGRAEARTAEIWHGVHGAQAWHLPSLEGSAGQDLPEESAAPPTAAELEQIHTAAREEGWKEGHAEGLAAGRAEAEEELRALQAIVAQLARPLEGLDTEVERALTNLSLSLARRIVGQCVEAEAENLRQLVHRVVSHLGPLESRVEVELSPHDYGRLQGLADLDRYWHLRSNPELQAGDVVVRQEDTQVDGRLLQRIERLATDMLDGA